MFVGLQLSARILLFMIVGGGGGVGSSGVPRFGLCVEGRRSRVKADTQSQLLGIHRFVSQERVALTDQVPIGPIVVPFWEYLIGFYI